MSLNGKVALITGGTGALGSVVVERLVREGVKVATTFRSDLERASLSPSLQQAVTFYQSDVTVEVDVIRLFDNVVNNFGSIDILVNTVGGFIPSKPIATMNAEDWDTMMTLNLRSTFLCMREALRRMHGRSYGRIISISAMTALKPSANKSAYAISKAGVIQLTEIAAEEVKGSGITVNAIAPSILLTKANVKSMPEEDSTKWVKPEEIAEAICCLCSDAASGITGTTLRAFGGV